MSKRKAIESHAVQREERRAAYRRAQAKAHRLSITMRTPKGEEHGGVFHDLSIGGASAKFAIHGNVVAVGETVELTIGSLSRPNKVVAKARVLFAKDSHGGRHCGFAFLEPQALAPQIDAFYTRFFNRRKAPRAGMPLDKKVKVKLFHGGVELLAELADLSVEGLQVRLSRTLAKELDGANHAHLRFHLPNSKAEISGRAAILRRTQLRDQVTLGLAFDLVPEDGIVAHLDTLAEWIVHRTNEIAKWDNSLTQAEGLPAPPPPSQEVAQPKWAHDHTPQRRLN